MEVIIWLLLLYLAYPFSKKYPATPAGEKRDV